MMIIPTTMIMIITTNSFLRQNLHSSAGSGGMDSDGGASRHQVDIQLLPRYDKPITRDPHTKELKFEIQFARFRPNLTPKEILQMGSFGGTYFRPIYSSITGQSYGPEVWQELPSDWLEGLNIKRQICSSKYDSNVNKYKVECGGSLEMWESSGWITDIDPYGWFQWYCRFYQGRRCTDDERQIDRAMGVMGATGRWRNNLANKCAEQVRCGRSISDVLGDHNISPKIRQLLQHWGYVLTENDLQTAMKKSKKPV
jgi:hypothetical protein